MAAVDNRLAARLAGVLSSVPLDFFVKASAKGDLRASLARTLPLGDESRGPEITLRALLLNCLTRPYAPLWRGLFDPAFRADRWTREDPRLPAGAFADLAPEWYWSTPLCTDYARRQTSVIVSPSSSRDTNRRRSSITEHSFHGIDTSSQACLGGGVTHVSGTICHLCLGPLRRLSGTIRQS